MRTSSGIIPKTDAMIRRIKTHCKHGHLFTPESTRYKNNGQRHCGICSLDQTRKREAKLSEEAKEARRAYFRQQYANDKENRSMVNLTYRLYRHVESPQCDLECAICYSKCPSFTGRAKGKNYFCSKFCQKVGDRDWRFRKNFGLTVEQYADMFISQLGVCAICQQECSSGDMLSVDHNHELKKGDAGFVRELLCRRCNRCLGELMDSAELFDVAAQYLRKHK